MLRRTKGRLLITLLVVTGLAGTLQDSSLSQTERKTAVTLLKTTKADLLKSVNGLSATQLDYRPSPAQSSIREMLSQLAQTEQKYNVELKALMKLPTNSDARLKIAVTDEQLIAASNFPLWKMGMPVHASTNGKDATSLLKQFTALRNDHIKYIRTSTEDLRNHVVSSPVGWIDCYQYFLMIADQTRYYAKKIMQLRTSQGFPSS